MTLYFKNDFMSGVDFVKENVPKQLVILQLIVRIVIITISSSTVLNNVYITEKNVDSCVL